MSNLQLRNAIIAIIIGAIVSILQKVAEAYVLVPQQTPTEIIPSLVSMGVYLKAMAKVVV